MERYRSEGGGRGGPGGGTYAPLASGGGEFLRSTRRLFSRSGGALNPFLRGSKNCGGSGGGGEAAGGGGGQDGGFGYPPLSYPAEGDGSEAGAIVVRTPFDLLRSDGTDGRDE